LGSLFELRRKQNLYANPKRTAKSKPLLIIRRTRRKKVQTFFKKLFCPAAAAIHTLVTKQLQAKNRPDRKIFWCGNATG
jgi:hypothetical protein